MHVSTCKQTYCQSLVDKGANEGVYGYGVIDINNSPHRHVNVQGIDNNEITSVHIFTVGTLARSQAVPVIIIMYQHAYHEKGKNNNSYVKIEWYKN